MDSTSKRDHRRNSDDHIVRFRDSSGHLRSRSFPTRRAARTFANRVETFGVLSGSPDRSSNLGWHGEYLASDMQTQPPVKARGENVAFDMVTTKGFHDLRLHVRLYLQFGHAGQRYTAFAIPKADAQSFRGTRPSPERRQMGRRFHSRLDGRTAGQASAPVRELDEDMQVFVAIATVTRLRFSEIAGLRLRDVELAQRRLSVKLTKTGKCGSKIGTRSGTLPAEPARLLESLLAERAVDGPSAPLFVDASGRPISMRSLHVELARGRCSAGLEGFRIHDLRRALLTRTYASRRESPS